jgi:hypothetical protein
MQPSGLRIEWSTVHGGQYQVQRSDNLLSWFDINAIITASNLTTHFIDRMPSLCHSGSIESYVSKWRVAQSPIGL